ncbi:MAG: hypothetical protein RBR54_04880 [Sulfurimonas sp.]|jgi:hypothetical protein|nr:hypothetical protein [Sulfurimonas sp.]
MKKTILMEKYPVYTLELEKNEIAQKDVDGIIEYFQNKIEAHPIARFISIFDHYSHTQALGGEINAQIKDAKNIVFCFGAAIPNTKILAVRPRSIAVAELENSFVVEFMEAPVDKLQEVMEDWAKELKVK